MDKEMRNICIVKELERRSKKVSGIKTLIGKIEEIARDASVLLDRVVDTFQEYTLHEKTHSLKVLKIMDRIIPKQTLGQMNELELTILILSAFLHDIGMVVARREKKEILESEEFNHCKEKYPRMNNSLKKANEQGNYRVATQIEDQILTFYLRESHAIRGSNFIKKKFGARLKYRDLDFSDPLCKVCRSHGEPWEKLGVRKERLHGYPLKEEYPTSYHVGKLDINIQFLAIVLRIADILDFDRERTPSILFEYLYPISEISLAHWLTHLSVQGWLISGDKVKYRVGCKHPLYQKAVNEFLDKVDAELQGAKLLMERFPANIAERYKMPLPRAVDRSEIGPRIVEGRPLYIYGDFQFGLDYDRVIALLSEELHYSRDAAIRELLQNSVDACRFRLALEKSLGTNWNKNEAQIHFVYDSNTLTLTVEDNGIGMDQEIVQNNFLKIGCSYYSKDNPRYLRDIATFRDKEATFYPISMFGIGILSCFMLADQIVVETRKKENNHLLDPIGIRVSPKLKMYVMRELEPSDWYNGEEPGTKITLNLTQPIDLKRTLKQFAINLEFNISATIDGKTTVIKPQGFGLNCFPEIKKKISDHLKEKRLKSYSIDLSRAKIEGVRGKSTLFFPCIREDLVLVLDHDPIDVKGIGLEEDLFDAGPYEPTSLTKTLATSQGIYVHGGLELSLPFPHITVIDFFGESRPELTLNRRSFKGDITSTEERLYDFLSTEIRRAILEGRLKFFSPFWEFLWNVKPKLQDFFLRDLKSRNELFRLPLIVAGKQVLFSWRKIREQYKEGFCIAFQRHKDKKKEYANFPDNFGNYSLSPPEVLLLAVAPNYRSRAHRRFWKGLYDWSQLTLVQNGSYYYMRIHLNDSVNPIYQQIHQKLELIDFEDYPRFAKYSGIPTGVLYSNNFAFALNLDHPLTRIFISCLEKACSEKDIDLTRSFCFFLRDLIFGELDLRTSVSLGRKLKKQNLISSRAVKLFKTNSLHIRNGKEVAHLFLEPPPLPYRYEWQD